MKLTSGRPGFTLIELLIVVLVVGILAMVSLFYTDKVSRRARYTAIQADLHNLLVQQELFFQSNLRYGGLGEISGFHETSGVDVEIPWVERNGFAAIGTHAMLPGNTCAVFIGPAPAGSADPATEPGVITCDY